MNTSKLTGLQNTFIYAVLASVMVIVLSVGTAHAATYTVQMELGDSGSNVTDLQTFLASDSSVYPEGLITGYFGALTKAAVMRYQAKMGISQVGRVGPQTLAVLNGSTGGATNTGDVNAPITTAITVNQSTTTATITWMNNEAVYGRVMYATTWPFLFATAASVSGTPGLNATQAVTLNGLQSQTTYYYVLEAIDSTGNLNWTIGNTFKTK